MSYGKNDVVNAATKLARLVNGGVVGYYAGGKTSEMMKQIVPEQLIDVIERHKKVQLGTSLAQSFVPGAGVAATAVAVASLWKMYYDINQVLDIKISENAGKSLTSAVLTNLSSAAAQGVATVVSEGAKFIPFVGWIASAGISAATSTAIVYGAAFLYLNALSAMYSAIGKFDFDYLESEIANDSSYASVESESSIPTSHFYSNNSNKNDAIIICSIVANKLGLELEDVSTDSDLEDDLGADEYDKVEIMHEIESTFGIDLGDEDSITYVDDLIEKVVGESFFGNNLFEDDEDNDDEEDDCEEEQSRFKSFFDSYLNEEYKEMSVEKKSSLFEREGEYCSNKTIKSMYYCVAAVIRLETFVEEWIVNGFDNYKSTLSEFKQECLVKGLNNITISRGILSEDKEYLLIEGTLLMLKQFWIELNNDANSYIDNYGNLLKIEKEEANLFNYEWLGKLFKLSYDAVLDHCNNDEDQVAAAEKEYLESVVEMLEDYGEIGPRERKRLEKERIHLGISEERAQQLEVELLKPSLTEEEQEYLEEFQEMLEDYDEIGARERKRLEKSRVRLGISEARAKELEKL